MTPAQRRPVYTKTYRVEVRIHPQHGHALYINEQLMSFLHEWDGKNPRFFMPDMWTFLAQEDANRKALEPETFVKMMKRMFKGRTK